MFEKNNQKEPTFEFKCKVIGQVPALVVSSEHIGRFRVPHLDREQVNIAL